MTMTIRSFVTAARSRNALFFVRESVVDLFIESASSCLIYLPKMCLQALSWTSWVWILKNGGSLRYLTTNV